MPEFKVTDASELFILQAALIEAKLPRLANDGDIAASPIVVRLAERVREAVLDGPQLGGANEDWRVLSPGHGYWPVALSRALADQHYLRKAARREQEEYVRLLLAPFRNDAGTVGAFLAELDQILAKRSWYQLWLRGKDPFRGGIAFLCQRADGVFVALDSERNEIGASTEEGDVSSALLERGLEPCGYFVKEGDSE